MPAGGLSIAELHDAVKTDLGDMVTRHIERDDTVFNQLVSRDTCTGDYERYVGWKRIDTPKRHKRGEAVAMTTMALWKMDVYPKMFALGITIDVFDKSLLDKRMGMRAMERARADLSGTIPEFDEQAFADMIAGTTSTLGTALQLTYMDGLANFDNTANRFGLGNGNLKIPASDGTEPGDRHAQVYEAKAMLENMTDDTGHPFHPKNKIAPSELMIVCSNEYPENWDRMLKANFYPLTAAVGSTANVFAQGGIAPPQIEENRRLSGKDTYTFYKHPQGYKPFRMLYYEWESDPENNVLSPGGINPAGVSKTGPGGSSFQFRQTSQSEADVIFLETHMSLCFKAVFHVEMAEAGVKFDIT